MIMNARMYAVSPEAEGSWQALLGHVTREAEVPLDYVPYPAPQPLEDLWARPDLGCVLMCGYPIALRLADVEPIAAPIPDAGWAGSRPVYRSDLIVRKDSPYRTLEDTFGGVAGWTVPHSHSGFNAFRHHLLRYRTPERRRLYREVKGNLVTARRILDSVLVGSIDVGPLDAWWHRLITRHKPELTEGIHVLDSTALAPIPAFVAGPALPKASHTRLAQAFAAAASRPWFAELAEPLCLMGFAPVTREGYAPTLAWHDEALAAGYPEPA
jgi:ABC-type phosphate/phosphonate transport system substrate-binding protein